jgi:ribonuclease J
VIEVTPLGGLGEFGKNCLVIRASGEALVIDAGISFPDESLPGVDRIAPDFSSLSGERVAGVFLTHAHEDHVGALSLLLEEIAAPVFATPFTRAMVERRIRETGVAADLRSVGLGATVEAGPFRVRFFPVSHSVPQSAAFLVEAGGFRILHTGDFKLDDDAPPGEATSLAALAREAGGCDLMLVDSTNAGRSGACPSERLARAGVGLEIGRSRGRVVLTTFSSHVARLAGAAEAAAAAGRKVAVLGRSMRAVVEIAEHSGGFPAPAGQRADRDAISGVPAGRLLVLCGGSQGEPSSALHRLALDEHPDLRLSPGDRVIFSARAIPGREKAVARAVDHLLRRGADVRLPEEDGPPVHVSGHAFRDDLLAVIRAIGPRAVLPVHGERLALTRCAAVAEQAGVDRGSVFVLENGDSLLRDGEAWSVHRSARPAGAVFLDSAAGFEVEGETVRQRRLLGSEGLLVVLARVGPNGIERVDVAARGLAADLSPLTEAVRAEVLEAFARARTEEVRDAEWARSAIALHARRVCRRRFGIRPLVVPIVAES